MRKDPKMQIFLLYYGPPHLSHDFKEKVYCTKYNGFTASRCFLYVFASFVK